MTESWSELLVQVDNHILTPSNRKLIVRCETNIYSLYRGAAQVELFVLWDPREAFWHDGGKVSPTIDQRGNRGDPDNSPLTGGVANHHRESLIFKFKHNLIDTIQSLVATLFFSVLLVMLWDLGSSLDNFAISYDFVHSATMLMFFNWEGRRDEIETNQNRNAEPNQIEFKSSWAELITSCHSLRYYIYLRGTCWLITLH